MNRTLINTSIVIDLLAKRTEFYQEAAELFSLSDKKELKLVISSLTFANTNYVLSKLKTQKEALKILVEIASLDDKTIALALSDTKFLDFEDGLQYYSAIENNN
ncbi:MAG: type II toxin-antitoxin system VapC family toxin [Flavobacteriaceae bacterium]